MPELAQLASLIKRRNAVEQEITALSGRPAAIGHLGEYIAAEIFHIALVDSASEKTIDGHFTTGPLVGRSVNIKWYAMQEGLLDITPTLQPDYFLVLAGPKPNGLLRRGPRPWLIESVHCFSGPELIEVLQMRPVNIGIATSVRRELWSKAEVYSHQNNPQLIVSDEQRRLLALFG
jgi:hypothetical protein